MRTFSSRTRLIVALTIAGGLLSLAGGGLGLALVDNTPTFAERSFLALEGRPPKVWPDIRMTCRKDGAVVYRQTKTSLGGGAYFTFGPTAEWTSGGATCTATLIAYRKDVPRILDELSFWVSG